jgi:hypothetical protein
MEPFYDILRKYPELAIFLTLAIGFYIGRLKIGGCGIGSVTGVLLRRADDLCQLRFFGLGEAFLFRKTRTAAIQ